jgi:hypothetical protein
MDNVFDLMIQIALTVLAVASVPLATFLVELVRRQLAKVKIELDAAGEARLRQITADVIAKIEELARRREKAGMPALTGNAKLVAAMDEMRMAVPGITSERAESMLMSGLQIMRATGAIDDAGKAPRTP